MLIYFLIAFLLISLIGIKFQKNDSLSKDQTTMINGIFVGIIFFHHFDDYVTYSNIFYDKFYYYIGQMMVATFLFFSGYGIYESIKNKKDYLKTFPKKRFLKLFINFALAIVFFIIANLIVGKSYDLKTTLLSFTAFEAIGNSNWYIFATFCMYIFILLCFRLNKKKELGLILMVILSILYVIFAVKIGKSPAWYNTVLCFPAGMIFSYFKDFIFKNNKRKIIFHIFSIILFFVFFRLKRVYWYYELCSIFFVINIIMACQYIKLDNKLLTLLGKYTFEIYILQRVSFILLRPFNLTIWLYLICSIILTIIICIIYKYCQKIIYKYIRI